MLICVCFDNKAWHEFYWNEKCTLIFYLHCTCYKFRIAVLIRIDLTAQNIPWRSVSECVHNFTKTISKFSKYFAPIVSFPCLLFGKISHNFVWYPRIFNVKKASPSVWTFILKTYWVNVGVKNLCPRQYSTWDYC